MRIRSNSEFTINDALEMYQRLRQRGQTSVLARLSVEALCADLPTPEKLRVRQILREYESRPAA